MMEPSSQGLLAQPERVLVLPLLVPVLLLAPVPVLLLALVPRRVVAPLPAVARGFVWPRRPEFQAIHHGALAKQVLSPSE